MKNYVTHKSPINLKKYGIITGALVIVNIILYNVAMNKYGFYTPEMNLQISIIGFLIVYPILCLPFGLLLALVPYKGIGYRQKRLPSILVFYLFFNIIFTIMTLAGMAR